MSIESAIIFAQESETDMAFAGETGALSKRRKTVSQTPSIPPASRDDKPCHTFEELKNQSFKWAKEVKHASSYTTVSQLYEWWMTEFQVANPRIPALGDMLIWYGNKRLRYAACIQRVDVELMARAAEALCKQVSWYLCRQQGSPPARTLNPDVIFSNREQVKLFAGVDVIREQVTCATIRTMLDGFLLGRNSDWRQRKKTYKEEFLGTGNHQRELQVSEGSVVVSKYYDLPDFIIVPFHFFNSRYKKESLVIEKQEMGKIVEANKKLYYENTSYKKMMSLFFSMSKYVIDTRLNAVMRKPVEIGLSQRNLLYFGHYLRCFQPVHRIQAIPVPGLGYGLFLLFPRELIIDDHVYIPPYSTLVRISGEIRPLDLTQDDRYSFNYMDESCTKTESPMVLTCQSVDDRPSLGSLAFLANHTCVSDSMFRIHEWNLGTKEANIFLNQNRAYKTKHIVNFKPITGSFIREQSQRFTERMQYTCSSVLLDGDVYYVPIEFNYTESKPIGDSALKCSCLHRCWHLPPGKRSTVLIGENAKERAEIQSILDRFVPKFYKKDTSFLDLYGKQQFPTN